MINYRVRIKNGDKEIEVEGDKKYINEMLGKLGFLEKGKATNGNASAVTQKKKATGHLSPAEFLFQFKFKRHVDLVLAFGYYIEKNKGLKSFTPADINTCYYEAKREPSNTSQMIIYNIKAGKLMEARGQKGKNKKIYTLTHSGIDYIEKHIKS